MKFEWEDIAGKVLFAAYRAAYFVFKELDLIKDYRPCYEIEDNSDE